MNIMKETCLYLYVDDERMREYPERILELPYVVALRQRYKTVIPVLSRSYHGAINHLNYAFANDIDIFLDLDNDLGEAREGYDICKYIVEHQERYNIVGFTIHSMNPVARANMKQLMNHYGYKEY